ncbi:MAG: hypothetical protein CR997_12015 [Acidobacteria bacterium]|nr:MAG: hypothetical protein CR997_12015 [Acidobacteriota bacterium]
MADKNKFKNSLNQAFPNKKETINKWYSDYPTAAKALAYTLDINSTAYKNPQQFPTEINRDVVPLTPETLLGSYCGPYKLIDFIGEGGMSFVFLGDRGDGQFQKKVAIKILKDASFASREKLDRFRSEQQFLATLNHSNIARILDGGIRKDGQPYFIMEYVNGLPLTEFCKVHKLKIRERLELFLQLCEAVQFSHRNLIIHRDLKPDNILVTSDRQVKLLDFGIAKATKTDHSFPNSNLTQDGQLIATPAYASPEALKGESITVSSDIYSLGLILYELLLGVHPFIPPSSTPIEAMYKMMNVTPLKPSVLLKANLKDDQIRMESKLTSQEQKKFQRELHGDLDTICIKTLQPEAERRYHSVDQLRYDVQMYLQGRPILARPDTVWYRFSKFFLRNQLVSWLSIALLTTFTYFSFNTIKNLNLIKKQNLEIVQERDRAEQTVDFLTNLFIRVDPIKFEDETLTAKAILDNGADLIKESLNDDRPSKIAILRTIGYVYIKLGQYAQAEECLDLSKELVLTGRDKESGAYIDVVHLQAILNMKRGHFQESLCYLADIGFGPDTTFPSNPTKETLDILSTRAMTLQGSGQIKEAEYLLENAIEAQRFQDNNDKRSLLQLATDITSYGALLQKTGRYQEAEWSYLQAMDLRNQLLDKDNPILAESHNNLGTLYTELKELDQAEPHFKRALSLLDKLYSHDHPYILATMNNLAGVQKKKGDLKESERNYREILKRMKDSYADDHPYVAGTKNNLGLLLNQMGRPDLAEPLVKESLDFYQARLGSQHTHVGIAINNYATILLVLNKTKQAAEYYAKAIEIYRANLGETHIRVSFAKAQLAVCLYSLGKRDKGLKLWSDVQDNLQPHFEANKPDLPDILINGAIILRRDKQYRKALKLLNQISDLGGTQSVSFQLKYLMECIHCHLALNQDEQARRKVKEARELLKNIEVTPYSKHEKLEELAARLD